ncbi:hypothetical protein CLF_105150 [Clonorchis sinensis]|uniref:Gap-Pol polyprotein n=1 Tax=Clonorchis sinensis TaxID=79923 RepID=G7YD27_CLOSI|nr:hypothetical protein CLF_105150 [Clonorchis sinensis]
MGIARKRDYVKNSGLSTRLKWVWGLYYACYGNTRGQCSSEDSCSRQFPQMESRKKAHEPEPSKQGCTSPIPTYKATKVTDIVNHRVWVHEIELTGHAFGVTRSVFGTGGRRLLVDEVGLDQRQKVECKCSLRGRKCPWKGGVRLEGEFRDVQSFVLSKGVGGIWCRQERCTLWNDILAGVVNGIIATQKLVNHFTNSRIYGRTDDFYSASSRTHVTSQCRLLSAVIDGPQQMWAKWLSIERETGCLYIKGAMHSPTREKAIKNKTNSSLPNHTDQCKCSSLIDVLATKLELLSKALTDANTKNAAIWTKVDKELSSLNEYLALSTPGLLAAKKVIQLSDAEIKTATASLVDRRVRESRLIIWGSFSRKVTPTKQAQSLLGSVLSKPDHESLHADWLRQKRSKRTLGLLVTLSSPSAVQKVLGRAVSVQKANPTIRRLSEDRPLDARKPGHSSSREEMRKKLPDGAISADPKLKAKPIVVIAPCAPESTPRQTTATPDSSFYSTTADPSNSTGNDALEEASLTWTERPKYVQLSALLSVTDVKGATENSTPKLQPSWIGSNERSQVVKPTGKPTTCPDVDIGECCENRTSTEAVKLPISSSTPPKVASLSVQKQYAQ